jgi:two-component system, OmpR family, response regulator MprA
VAENAGLVLVVEDEPQLRGTIVDILRIEGYTVIEAVDGAEALALVDRPPAHADRLCLVILDMMLPGITGMGVLRHLTRRTPRIPVLAISASRTALEAAAAAGARAALPKPFDLDQLLTLVAHHAAPLPP